MEGILDPVRRPVARRYPILCRDWPLYAVVFALFLIVPSVLAADIAGPTEIREPGTYRLTADITFESGLSAITVSASDVVIEGGGHLVQGPGQGRDAAGVHVANGLVPPHNVTIRNLRVDGFQYGVYLVGATGCRVESVTATANRIGIGANQGADSAALVGVRCTGNRYGIALASSNGATVRDCVITGNSDGGSYLYSTGGNTFSNNRFENAKNVVFADTPRPNAWNSPVSSGTNIAGGSSRGGNLWLQPDGEGFSQTTPNRGDGFCRSPYVLADGNSDELPYAAVTSASTTATAAPAATTVAPPPPSVTVTPTEGPTSLPTETPSPSPTTPAPTTATPTPSPITGATVISTPGTYAIGADIVGTDPSAAVITITCSDVTLLGNGHVIDGPSGGWGILLHNEGGPLSNIEIRDVTVRDFAYGIIFVKVSGGSVEDSRVTDCSQFGLGLSDAGGNRFVNNEFVNVQNVNFYYGQSVQSNTWNLDKTSGTNIVGGPNVGGNYWGKPDKTGFSDIQPNRGDGFCPEPYHLDSNNVDNLPLAALTAPTATPTPTAGPTTPSPTMTTAVPTTPTPTKTIPIPSRTQTPVTTGTTVLPTTGPVTATPTPNGTVTVTPTPNVTVTVTPTGNVTPTVSPTVTPNPTVTIIPPVPPVPTPPADARAITGPIVITEPGYYLLQNDILSTDALVAIDIRSSDVIVNGNGHTVSGNGLFNTYGVSAYRADGPLSNVQVANLEVEHFYYGCSFWNTHDGRIDSVTVRDTFYGILLQSSTGNLIHACEALFNRQGGLLLLAASDGNTLYRNRADDQNWGLYLSASERNLVLSNRAERNRESGIGLFAAGNSTIANNYLNNSANAGFDGSPLPNLWNINLSVGKNIIGGRLFGGNFWAKPDGTGFSEVSPDDNNDGICDIPYELAPGNTDDFALHGPNASADYIPITGPTVITEPGRYRLLNDITATAPIGIEIRASDVDLDGAGHVLAGAGTYNTYGVLAYNTTTPLSGVRVTNLSVENWWYGCSYRSVRDSEIGNLTASKNTYGTVLTGSSTVRVDSVTASRNEQGGILLLEGSTQNEVTNATADGNLWGVYLSGSDANVIVGCWIVNNTLSGIDLVSSGDNAIVNNALRNTNNTALQGTVRANIWNLTPLPGPNVIWGRSVGGNYYGSPNGTGFSDLVPDRDGDGFCDAPYEAGALNSDRYPLAPTWSEPFTPITGPTVITSPGRYRLQGPITLGGEGSGIEVRSSDVDLDGAGFTITGSRAPNSNGVLVTGAGNVTVRNLTVSSCHVGVSLVRTNSSVVRNVVADSNDYGVASLESQAVRIEGTAAGSNTYAGISFETTRDSLVYNTTANRNEFGVLVVDSSNCVVRDCRTDENSDGLHLSRVQGVAASNHSASKNDVGIQVEKGNDRTRIEGAEAFENGVGLQAVDSAGIVGISVNATNSTGEYGISIQRSPNSLLQGCTASNGTYGIYLSGSENAAVAGSRADGNRYAGVALNASSGAGVTDGRFSANGGAGVQVYASDRAEVKGNQFYNNSVGIRLERSRENRVTDNSIEASGTAGLFLLGADASTASGNRVRGEKAAIRLSSSRDNRVANNVLVGTPPVDISADSTPNTWQSQIVSSANIIGGPSIGGNYYGLTAGSGFSEVTIDDNHDGFCDRPYALNDGNVDSLPLAPWSAVPTQVPVVPAFGVDGRAGIAPYTVRFHDESTGHPTRWSWSFGDGGTSAEQHPVHTYTTPGIFTVTLVAENALGSVAKTERKFVTVWGTAVSKPVANFVVEPASGKAPLGVRFNDTSVGYPSSWVWTFGDGASSHLQNPTHRYMNEGTYTVTLLVKNDHGEDTEVKTGLVTVERYLRTMGPG